MTIKTRGQAGLPFDFLPQKTNYNVMNLPAASYGVSIFHFNLLAQQAAGY